MYFGYHVSIEGGIASSVDRGVAAGCDSIQIFTGPPRQWGTPRESREEALEFRKRKEESGIAFAVFHSIYLVNLASPDDSIYNRTISALVHSLEKAERLDAYALVTHVGNHKGAGELFGLDRIAAGITDCLEKADGNAMLLLETTAGAGTSIGGSFEQFGRLFDAAGKFERLGFCLDTSHIFAAGYDIRTPDGIDRTLDELDRFVGLERLKLVHMNDSKVDCGTHVDRHEHIGEGKIGIEAFKYMVNHEVFRDLPAIAELPYENQEGKSDLDVLRSLENKRIQK